MGKLLRLSIYLVAEDRLRLIEAIYLEGLKSSMMPSWEDGLVAING